jgi:hypothetical protein
MTQTEQVSSPPIGFGKNVNDFLLHHVSLADAKAGFVISVDFAVSGILLARIPDDGFARFVTFVAVGLLVMSLICGISVVYPRTSTKPTGLIFWEAIRELKSYDDYMSEVRKLDTDAVEKQYAEQNWHISELLETKFQWTQYAMMTLLAGMLVALVSLAVV